jgi:hypothetical protein
MTTSRGQAAQLCVLSSPCVRSCVFGWWTQRLRKRTVKLLLRSTQFDVWNYCLSISTANLRFASYQTKIRIFKGRQKRACDLSGHHIRPRPHQQAENSQTATWPFLPSFLHRPHARKTSENVAVWNINVRSAVRFYRIRTPHITNAARITYLNQRDWW